jgi:hypothetical protein
MTAPDREIWTRAAEPSGRGRPDHRDQEVHGGAPTVWEKRRNAVGARAGAGPRPAVEAVLAEVAGGVTPADPTWPDRLIEAMAMLRDHILKEQDGVFPAALANLSTEECEAVEATRAKAGSTLPRPTARVNNPAGQYG